MSLQLDIVGERAGTELAVVFGHSEGRRLYSLVSRFTDK